jgi:hypothetical protein
MSREVVSTGKTLAKYKMRDLFFVYAYHRITHPSKERTGDVDDVLNSFTFLFGAGKEAARHYLNALLSSEGYFSIKEYDSFDSSHGHLMIKLEKKESAKHAYDRLISDENFLEFMERNVSPLARRGDIPQ